MVTSGRSFISTSMIECLRSSNVVDPGARTPPTDPLKSVSPVKTSESLIRNESIPAVWPGVAMAWIVRPPTVSVSPARMWRSTSMSSSDSTGSARISTPKRSL